MLERGEHAVTLAAGSGRLAGSHRPAQSVGAPLWEQPLDVDRIYACEWEAADASFWLIWALESFDAWAVLFAAPNLPDGSPAGASLMITREHTQEALSHAFVHALAGIAGLNLAARTIFDYGVDGTFHLVKILGGERIQTGHPVDFQMKATTRWNHQEEFVVYDLEARAHRLLTTDREAGMPLAILILLCLPTNPEEWFESLEQHLHLRHCCYWYRPEGPPTQNKETTRVRIPRSNLLTPNTLKEIMQLARREALGL